MSGNARNAVSSSEAVASGTRHDLPAGPGAAARAGGGGEAVASDTRHDLPEGAALRRAAPDTPGVAALDPAEPLPYVLLEFLASWRFNRFPAPAARSVRQFA